jgi:hypothetical protein
MSDEKDQTTEARAIRDAALVLLRRVGRSQTTGGKTPVRILFAEVEDLRIVHNTPFTPRPMPSSDALQSLATTGREPLPYAMDIWHGRTKMFSISWSDDDFRVTTFKKGTWTSNLGCAEAAQGSCEGSLP